MFLYCVTLSLVTSSPIWPSILSQFLPLSHTTLQPNNPLKVPSTSSHTCMSSFPQTPPWAHFLCDTTWRPSKKSPPLLWAAGAPAVPTSALPPSCGNLHQSRVHCPPTSLIFVHLSISRIHAGLPTPVCGLLCTCGNFDKTKEVEERSYPGCWLGLTGYCEGRLSEDERLTLGCFHLYTFIFNYKIYHFNHLKLYS